MRPSASTIVLALALALPASVATAQGARELVIDATRQPSAPATGFLRLGTFTSPDRHTITANSRYLERDGRPWIPVMGEFHFSRYPEQYWEEEILKMKAGGVQIIASYFFWNHHEEIEGQFDWTGRRDARRFVELCRKHGMLFWARIGPWSHGEARNGGFPDWLLRQVDGRARSDDSTYLAHVSRFYAEIGRELRGQLWKDGGPVIGVQLENEYTPRGAGRGPGHILHLKALALDAGLDVPLYTVTGWDGASFPPAEVIPVFGGYPDWPWDASIRTLPPNEVYAFRFENRVAGNMGAQGRSGERSETSAEALAPYPFLGAEYAGGIQITYHRRPVITTDDVAAMLPVQLGSGVNLYGYYMFHGGANPPGKLTTLQESQLTGYPTDVPVVSYDFQAPLSEYGEMRESFRRLKLFHYFLNEFGDRLAPMVVHRPETVPASPADTSVPRLSARTLGDSGFIFVGNYLRNYDLPARPGVQVVLRLPSETLRVPASAIDVPAGAYFVWPVNVGVGSARLKYSTAQLLTRVADGVQPVYVFFAVPGIAPEFSFDAARIAQLSAPSGRVTRGAGRIVVTGLRPGTGTAISIRTSDGARSSIVLLTRQQAEDSWRATLGGRERLILSPHDLFVSGDSVHLRSRGTPEFTLAVFPALAAPPGARASPTGPGLRRAGRDGIFTRSSATLPVRSVRLEVRKVRDAEPVPPVRRVNTVTWRTDSVALAPDDSAFARAAAWRIGVRAEALPSVSDVFLEVRYSGDVARLYAGDVLLDDDFFKGMPWRIGLKRFARVIAAGPLELRVLPLRADAPVYFQGALQPSIPAGGQLSELREVRAMPEYELVVGVTP